MTTAAIVDDSWLRRARLHLRGAAACDTIFSPDWEFRYFSFDPAWGNDWLGSARNGLGSEMFLTQTSAGVFICYLDPEFPPLGQERVDVLRQSAPAGFHEAFDEPAFRVGQEAVAIGFAAFGQPMLWSASLDLNGHAPGTLLSLFLDVAGPNGAETYSDFVQDYFGDCLEGRDNHSILAAVRPFFEGQIISREMVKRLFPDANFEEVGGELEAMGFRLS